VAILSANQSQLKEATARASKPLLKWAGGKTQMIPNLLEAMPRSFNNYIEPFIGGGALFFHLSPNSSVIADSNPELINLYKQVAKDYKPILGLLEKMPNVEDFFYQERSKRFEDLSPVQAAARTLYLNRTCFNGLFRVNKSGGFNVPFGKYKEPKIADAQLLRSASETLGAATIVLGDYKGVLHRYAKKGDLVFLDPPYLPISQYSDFQRYTKEQFYEDDHRELAAEVSRLSEIGCHVLLTNSNHPLVHELYSDFHIEVLSTKRNINSNAALRKGQDVLVTALPKVRRNLKTVPEVLPNQTSKYPKTRFMGSKQKLLQHISESVRDLDFDTVIDLFSGSGIVGYMFKAQGKRVISNDHMRMSQTFTKALVENNAVTLDLVKAKKMLLRNTSSDKFVQKTFKGLYFTDAENKLIDNIRTNIQELDDEYETAIAMMALIRACTKKRPRGIFTYVGARYDDGRKDLRTSLGQHFLEAVLTINNAVFDNSMKNVARNTDAMKLKPVKNSLVYIDPPYFTPKSDADYVRRYHFVEGLARNWDGVEIQEHTLTKKFKGYPTPFSTQVGASNAFDLLFKRFSENILLVSYSSNSLPSLDEMVALMSKHKEHVEVIPVDYKYSFGNQKNKVGDNRNSVQEYLFLGY
jgi:DNA adenine methylase